MRLFLIGLVWYAMSSSSVFGQGAQPRVKFIHGKWGKGLGEFGLVDTGPGEWGRWPNDFYVDHERGLVYVLDDVNERVQVFSEKSGDFVRVDTDVWEKTLGKGYTRMRIGPSGRPMPFAVGYLLKEEEELFPNKNNYSVQRKRERTDGETTFSTLITLPSRRTIEFSSKESWAFWGCLEGEDKDGNIYVAFSPGGKHIIEFVKVSPEGKETGRVSIYVSRVRYYYQSSRFRISSDGSLWLMSCDEKGFWIDYYPAASFDDPKGRDFSNLYPPGKYPR